MKLYWSFRSIPELSDLPAAQRERIWRACVLQAFRQAAQSVAQSGSSFGAYYRAMRARLGPKQAIVATAHKIARTVYHLLKTDQAYQEESADEYERKRREREFKHLQRRARKLGYILTSTPTGTPELQLQGGENGSS